MCLAEFTIDGQFRVYLWLNMNIATIIEGGNRFHQERIALICENQTDAERIEIWSESPHYVVPNTV